MQSQEKVPKFVGIRDYILIEVGCSTGGKKIARLERIHGERGYSENKIYRNAWAGYMISVDILEEHSKVITKQVFGIMEMRAKISDITISSHLSNLITFCEASENVIKSDQDDAAHILGKYLCTAHYWVGRLYTYLGEKELAIESLLPAIRMMSLESAVWASAFIPDLKDQEHIRIIESILKWKYKHISSDHLRCMHAAKVTLEQIIKKSAKTAKDPLFDDESQYIEIASEEKKEIVLPLKKRKDSFGDNYTGFGDSYKDCGGNQNEKNIDDTAHLPNSPANTHVNVTVTKTTNVHNHTHSITIKSPKPTRNIPSLDRPLSSGYGRSRSQSPKRSPQQEKFPHLYSYRPEEKRVTTHVAPNRKKIFIIDSRFRLSRSILQITDKWPSHNQILLHAMNNYEASFDPYVVDMIIPNDFVNSIICPDNIKNKIVHLAQMFNEEGKSGCLKDIMNVLAYHSLFKYLHFLQLMLRYVEDPIGIFMDILKKEYRISIGYKAEGLEKKLFIQAQCLGAKVNYLNSNGLYKLHIITEMYQ